LSSETKLPFPRSSNACDVKRWEQTQTNGPGSDARAIFFILEAGLNIDRELLLEVRDQIQWVQVSAPFGGVNYAHELLDALTEFGSDACTANSSLEPAANY